MTNEEIIREELQKVADDAIKIYEQKKKASGNWPTGIRIETSKNKGELYSYEYLAGRGPTINTQASKPTLREKILEWLKIKGIKPIEKSMKLSSLAFLIARKIHRAGTDPARHLAVFEEVLTPERIQSIIDRVSEFNIGVFVGDVQVMFEKLEKYT